MEVYYIGHVHAGSTSATDGIMSYIEAFFSEFGIIGVRHRPSVML